MRHHLLSGGAAAVVLVMLTGPALADDFPGLRHARPVLEGAWEVVVTLRVPAPDCATAAVFPIGPNPFPSFNTFHEGGTMSEWGSRAPPATRSSGHGVWKRIGFDEFGYRFMFHSFDGNGFLTATMDISADLQLARDGQTFVGVSRFVRTDISGNVQNFCATLEGERFSLS